MIKLKHLFILSILMLGQLVAAQVKIGGDPASIGSSSLLEVESPNQGLVVTRAATTASVISPVNGMIIYDLSSGCFKAYQSGVWSSCGFGVPESAATVITNEIAAGVPSSITAALLTESGITGAVAANQIAYRTSINDNPGQFSVPATNPEIQAMVNAVNAMLD